MTADALAALDAEITSCRRCPRLVEWRERVAAEKRRAFADQVYWGRPVPGFGPAGAPLLIVGLAPAAHGANRTGRVFTGDRSGDVLVAAMHAVGLANQPVSRALDDGLALIGCRLAAAVRCAPPANAPTPAERDTCLPFLVRELTIQSPRVVLALGGIAWDAALRVLAQTGRTVRPKPRFGHGAEAAVGDVTLVGCYHPSQQNTFTGRLTPAMMEAVLARAKALAA
ncbi:MAG: uracil-DNA glycosylase [Thermoleophilia bacterium]|nr:uracil-DNA glycosylase [Thermoleophilia bacterium]